MTDEEYILLLIERGFEQSQVNQLLKIYVYTKEYGLDLSKLDLNVDEGKLRQFARDLKDGNVKHGLLSVLRDAQNKKINLTPYMDSKYNHHCLSLIIDCEEKKNDVSLIQSPEFSDEQLVILIDAIEKGIDITKIANPKYEFGKMRILCLWQNKGIDLFEIIDPEKYSKEQIDLIGDVLNREFKYPVDISLILHPEYSAGKMRILVDVMANGYDLSIFKKEYPDANLKYIYAAIENEFDKKYIDIFKNDKLTETQMERMFEFIEVYLTDSTSSKNLIDLFEKNNIDIFNEEYDWPTLDILFEYLRNNPDIDFLSTLLNKNYSFEKIHELIMGKDNNLSNEQLDILREISDVSELHFTRVLFEFKNRGKDVDKYLDKSKNIESRISEYIKDNTEKEIEAKKSTKPMPKYFINCDYDNKQYFLTNDSIIEIGYETDPYFDEDECPFGIFDCEQDYLNDFFDNNKEDIMKLAKTFFMVIFDKETNSLATYDIKKRKKIEDELEYYNGEMAVDYLYEDDFYDDFCESILTYIRYDDTDKYISPFSNFEELTEYGGPNINNQVFVEKYREYYGDEHIIVATLQTVQNEYGEVNEENIKKAKLALADAREYLEDILEGRVLYYKEYDLDGEEIDSCYMFVGDYAIDDIEANAGEFIKEIGTFDSIEDCLDALNQHIEEER